MLRVGNVPVSDVKLLALFVCSVILFPGAEDASVFVELKEVPMVVDEFYSDLVVSFKDVVPVGCVRGSLRFKENSFPKEFRR